MGSCITNRPTRTRNISFPLRGSCCLPVALDVEPQAHDQYRQWFGVRAPVCAAARFAGDGCSCHRRGGMAQSIITAFQGEICLGSRGSVFAAGCHRTCTTLVCPRGRTHSCSALRVAPYPEGTGRPVALVMLGLVTSLVADIQQQSVAPRRLCCLPDNASVGLLK